MAEIRFGKWLPDQFSLSGLGAEKALNVVPVTEASYGPIPALAESWNALEGTCLGAGSFRGQSNGAVLNVAGTASKLYNLESSVWTDRSKMGGYTVATGDKWCFTQFGDDVIASNGTDDLQVWTIGTSTDWADLGGSPPAGRFVAQVRDFVFTARMSGALNKVAWSAINNDTGWTAGVDQSDDQLIPIGGAIMSMVGGEICVVISESGINRFSYVGSPLIFQRDQISIEHGTPCQNATIGYQGSVFFVSWDGFWALENGNSLVPIGDQQVDRTFWNDPEIAVNQAFLYNVIGAYDPINKLAFWIYPSVQSTNGMVDSAMIWNRTLNRWSFAHLPVDWIYRATTSQGYNIDTLDAVYGNLDAVPVSLDSPLLLGSGKFQLAAFTQNYKFANFGGANMEAVIDTTEGQIVPGRRALATEIWPLVDGGTAITAAVGYRNAPNDAVSFATATQQNAVGFCPARVDSRLFRARITIPAGSDWNHAMGINAIGHASGTY
jgi:hypothetical protein